MGGTIRSVKVGTIGLALIALGGGCATTPAVPEPPAPTAVAAAPPPASAADGVYTAAQAERGREVFDRVCSTCHGGNEFSGRMFELTWMAESVGYLFQHIRSAMPQDAPGSLSPEAYAAVVAYMLQINGRPAGAVELPPDPEALRAIRW